jgi:ABC-type polysaccharide/polyol phosphate export permease
VEQANLITKTVFPAEIVPVAIFLSSLVSHLLAVGLVMVAAAVALGNFSPMLLLLPVYVLVTGLFAIGIGWIVSSLQVYLRDTAQVVTVLMTFWFWLTPVFISEKQFPAGARFLLTANPISYVVRAYRMMLLGQARPSLRDLATVAALSITAFVLGGLFFRFMKKGFADVL